MATKVFGVITELNDKVSINNVLNNATGDEKAFSVEYEVNKATSGNDYGIYINMTDVLSPSYSYLIWAGVGGSARFSVSNAGSVIATGEYVAPKLRGNGLNVTLTIQDRGFSSSGYGVKASIGSVTNSSGEFGGLFVTPNINQSGTASYAALGVDVTETALGTGISYLLALRIGGSTKFGIRRDIAYTASSPTATGTVPIEINGTVYNFLVST